MPEIAGHPEWAIDIDRVHDWLASEADRVERREMHDRRRYWVDGGLVEVVDPVGNEEFCANCGRVRLTHEGHLKGCLNRGDDLRPVGETKAEMRAAFRRVVADRVPYYGEYLVRDGDGGWTVNEAYLDDGSAAPDAPHGSADHVTEASAVADGDTDSPTVSREGVSDD